MLAELQQLSKSLVEFQISPAEVHKWVKPISRGPFLIANLDDSGTIREVELRESSDGSGIVKIQKDNQNGFPTFKLACPLFAVPADHPLRERLNVKTLTNAQQAELLRSLCADAGRSGGFEKSAKRIAQFRPFAFELSARFAPYGIENTAIARLFSGIMSESFEPELAIQQIVQATIAALERGESATIAEQVLIGSIKRSRTIDSGDLPVFLDAWRAAAEDFPRVAHPKTQAFYSRVLLSEGTGVSDGLCGVSGEAQELEIGNLPSPRLPALSDTILFSANNDIPCLERYGRIGSKTFPIGKRTADSLNRAALWVTDATRRGKTWATVTRNDDAKSDLVIAYVDSNPDLKANLAELMAGPEQREAAFEATAASVVDALRVQKLKRKNAVLHTLVLRRISKGQVQVELSREYQVERIFEAFTEWQAAATNAPGIALLVPAGRGKPSRLIEPRTPFPGEIVQATKSMWIRSGGERQATIGCSLTTVYDLYLGNESTARAAARIVLSVMLERCTRLLLLTGDQVTRYGRGVLDLPIAARTEAVLAATILGITLYKLDRRKEFYMNETAFLLGRLLGLSDVLHKQYCQVVRRGDLPPQLLGNQHYVMAADRPARALAVLGERLRIYQAWAETARVEGEAELQRAAIAAKWAMRQMSEVAPLIHNKLPARGFDDEGKAEMLLGYLSRGRKESKEGEEDSEQ